MPDAKPTKAQVEELFAVHNGTVAQEERALRSYGLDVSRQWAREGGYRLSDSVWDARTATRDQIDLVLRQAIADGTDALEVAKVLEQYLDPAYAVTRNPLTGRLIGKRKLGTLITRAPGRSGFGSASARRLARTEISRAHAQGTAFAAARTPFAKGQKWNLSNRHGKPDECDRNATRDVGLGPGVYPPNDFPRMPNHPNDLCFSTIETEDDVDAVIESLRERYNLAEAP